eukprot:gene3903-7116_t
MLFDFEKIKKSLNDYHSYYIYPVIGYLSSPKEQMKDKILPDRLVKDYNRFISRDHKEEWRDYMENEWKETSGQLTSHYPDCILYKRNISLGFAIAFGFFGLCIPAAKPFQRFTIGNVKNYFFGGSVFGFCFGRYFYAPRNFSCAEQIMNQELSERIIEKGFEKYLENSKQNEMDDEFLKILKESMVKSKLE